MQKDEVLLKKGQLCVTLLKLPYQSHTSLFWMIFSDSIFIGGMVIADPEIGAGRSGAIVNFPIPFIINIVHLMHNSSPPVEDGQFKVGDAAGIYSFHMESFVVAVAVGCENIGHP